MDQDDLHLRAAALRDWARGDLALEAAVELLVTAVGGRLLDGPWVRRDERGRWYFHTKDAVAAGGHLSGGERDVLAIALSLAVSNRPVDLGDAITGLDPDTLEAVLAALAHAGGLHTRPPQPDQARTETKPSERSERGMGTDPDARKGR